MICSKIVNFNRTEAGLTSKWGRILPAVQWSYQNQFNCTVRQRATSPTNLLHGRTTEYGLYSEVTLAKNIFWWDFQLYVKFPFTLYLSKFFEIFTNTLNLQNEFLCLGVATRYRWHCDICWLRWTSSRRSRYLLHQENNSRNGRLSWAMPDLEIFISGVSSRILVL